MTVRSVDVLGVRVDDVTYDEAVALVDSFIRAGGPHVVDLLDRAYRAGDARGR